MPIGRRLARPLRAIVLERFEAASVRDAIDVLKEVWREHYNEDAPSALIGLEPVS